MTRSGMGAKGTKLRNVGLAHPWSGPVSKSLLKRVINHKGVEMPNTDRGIHPHLRLGLLLKPPHEVHVLVSIPHVGLVLDRLEEPRALHILQEDRREGEDPRADPVDLHHLAIGRGDDLYLVLIE